MRRSLIIAALLLASIGIASAPANAQVDFSISFGDFYSSLGPYGEWVYVDYGVYAWRPVRIVNEWRPYTYGRWAWSAHGWYWVSDEPWSWAVYHYGRWHYDDYYGWIWIPGYDWAPAWVEWRYGPDYVGWAPLGPYAQFSPSRGLYYTRSYRAPYDHWTFVSHGHMTRPNVYRYRYQGDDIRRVYGESRATGTVRYRNGTMESRGPDREYVERRGNVRIGTADVVDVDDYSRVRATRQGERERLEVYRPQVKRDETERPVRPDRVTRSDRAPSIESRYLDQRMRPEVREDDRARERADRERQDVRQPDARQRPEPAVRPQDRQQTVPQATPRDRERSLTEVQGQDRERREKQARESQAAVREPSKQRKAKPDVLRDSRRPEAPRETQRPEQRLRER